MPGGTAGRPSHPRFSATGAAGMRGGEFSETGGDPAAVEAVSPDDLVRQWIYVDFKGKPLTSAELAASPDTKLVHLVPFTLRAVMDQRKIDALLAALAMNEVPIDVRQVRINPGNTTAGGPEGRTGGLVGNPGAVARPNDVVVEFRGTVAVANPPNEAVLLGTPPAEGAPGA